MKKMNVFVVHGAYGYSTENWFAWLRVELDKLGIACMVPDFPTPKQQYLSVWMERFNDQCQVNIHQESVLIGHSLGAAFLCKWLEQAQINVATFITVGAFVGKVGIKKFDSINQNFFSKPFKWQEIRKKYRQAISFYGTNDPYVPKRDFAFIAGMLKAQKIIVANAKHFNSASGYTQFPHLLHRLQQIREIK